MVHIVFDGLYSAGKSTQLGLLQSSLDKWGLSNRVTAWNSSELLSQHLLEWRIAQRLNGRTLLHLELADFAERWWQGIEMRPIDSDVDVAVCDRYVQSAGARALVRGVPLHEIEAAISCFPSPDLVLLFQVAPEVASRRRAATDRSIRGYVSGEDFLKEPDHWRRFTQYQSLLLRAYRVLYPHAVTLDGEMTAHRLHEIILGIVSSYLDC